MAQRFAISAGMSRRQLLEAAGTAAGAAAVAAVGLAGPAEAQVPPPQIGQAWVNFWNSRDPNSAAVLFTSDVFYEDVTAGAINHGLKELEAFAQGYFQAATPDSTFTLVRSDLRGDHGYIEWLWSATDTIFGKTGKKFSVRGATAVDLAGNKIARNSDYWDLATLYRLVGLLPNGL